MKHLLFLAVLFTSFLARPATAQNQFEVLVYAMPSKYHYEYIPIAKDSFQKMAVIHQFGLTWADNPHYFDGDLSKYAVIVFLDTQADALSESQRENFVNYIHNGGGFVAVHKTIGEADYWPWFAKLVGRTFINHPMIQTAEVSVTEPDFPAVLHYPKTFLFTDEWYATKPIEGIETHTVLTVDESTYDLDKIWPGQKCEAMGVHPEAWYHDFEGGRSFTTALGHIAKIFDDQQYLDHIYGGIWWAATGRIHLSASGYGCQSDL